MMNQFSMLGRFGVAIGAKNGLSMTKTLASFADGLSSALFSPMSLSDTFRQASATVAKNDEIYRQKSIELFRNLAGHVDSTLGQFIREAVELFKTTTGLLPDTPAFDLRVAADAVSWYYREALKYTGMVYTMADSGISYIDEFRVTPANEDPVHHYGIWATILDVFNSSMERLGIYETKTIMDKAMEGNVKGLLEAGWSSFIKYLDPTTDTLTYLQMLRNGVVDTLIGGLRMGALVTQKAACDCILVVPAVLLGLGVNAVGAFAGEIPVPGFSTLGKSLKRVGRGIAYLSFRDPGSMKNAVLGQLKYRIVSSATVVMSQLLSEMIVTTLEKGLGLDNFLGGSQDRLLISLFLQQVFVSSYNHHVARRLNKDQELVKEGKAEASKSPQREEIPLPADGAAASEPEFEEDDGVVIAGKQTAVNDVSDDDTALESIFQ